MSTPKKPTISTRVEKITPAKAESYLERNTHNRPLRNKRVEELVAAIERGEWIMNGDAIRFAADGSLADGQHRLWAIALSGIACESVVIEGLSEQAQSTMDTGARRSLSDTLKLRGYNNHSRLASALNYLWKMEEHKVRERSAKPTIAQALALLEAHPTLQDSATPVGKLLNRFRGSAGQLMAIHYVLASIDSEDADTFFDKITSGVGLTEKDPIYLLRSWMERQSMSGIGSRSSIVVTHAMFIKAWNFWRNGEEIHRLFWKAAGLNAEAIPEPI